MEVEAGAAEAAAAEVGAAETEIAGRTGECCYTWNLTRWRRRRRRRRRCCTSVTLILDEA